MRFLVTGANGQLGFDCVKELKNRGFNDILITDIYNLDITNESAVNIYVKSNKPDVIFHCAAYTAVDNAEIEKNKAYEVNVLGTKFLAEAAEQIGAKLIYISTDYVFSGKNNKCYDTNDFADPINYYGKTKLEGEHMASKCSRFFIVRTSWVFGLNGNNFVKTMLKICEKQKTINVVCDQIGSPTYTPDLSKLICDLAFTDKYGIYHATNENYCSWFEFAKAIFALAKKEVIVCPITTKEYMENCVNKALRPLNSRLSKKSLDEAGFSRLPSWEDALERYLMELKEI